MGEFGSRRFSIAGILCHSIALKTLLKLIGFYKAVHMPTKNLHPGSCEARHTQGKEKPFLDLDAHSTQCSQRIKVKQFFDMAWQSCDLCISPIRGNSRLRFHMMQLCVSAPSGSTGWGVIWASCEDLAILQGRTNVRLQHFTSCSSL